MSETNVDIIEQLKKIHEENTVLREALEQMAEPMDYEWYRQPEDAQDVVDTMVAMARMALTKVEGKKRGAEKLRKEVLELKDSVSER